MPFNWLTFAANQRKRATRDGHWIQKWAAEGDFVADVHSWNGPNGIEASYTQKKRGRVIIGFDFKFTVKQKAKPKDKSKDKTERDPDTIDLFNKMTDKQIAVFSKKLAELPALGSNAPIGASAEQYADIIAKDLANPLKWQFYKPFLLQVGFKV